MAQKIFKYRGKTLEELQKMSLQDFAKLIPARQRRSLLRETREEHHAFMRHLQKKGNNTKTHCRDIVITPIMVGKTVQIHHGKGFVPIGIQPEMIGHFLGEFALTRTRVTHSAPGIGATKSSSNLSVK
ncbi:30S ribosomal protein S19 [Candidatus Woesearchaeota archaeon]|nr:30S ribosomal protein S19 [Candidatus Woesearchaeota archaeon]